MKIERRDYEFNNPRICHLQPKQIELDRVLINLYMLLKYNGQRPVTKTGRREVTLKFIMDQLLSQHAHKLHGFENHPEIVQDWIHSDLLDLVFRGNSEKEKVAAPLPLHLNAYKLRNPAQARDYQGAEHLYSLMQAADPDLVVRLKNFLGQGMDPTGGYDKYDSETSLDLDTLMIVHMVDNPVFRESPSSVKEMLEAPLCIGQARLLCDDLRRLLVYEKHVPRSVMIGYLRTAIGFHLGLYLLRLFSQLNGWVHDKTAHSACRNCPVKPSQPHPFVDCPYAFQNTTAEKHVCVPEIILDMGDEHISHMSQIAMDNCATTYDSMNDYIRAVFMVNQLFQYTKSSAYQKRFPSSQPQTVIEVLHLLENPPEGMAEYFFQRIDLILPDGVAEERPEVRSIYEMKDLPPWETFVELVALERTPNYRKEFTRQLDSVFMKNQETCLMRQGKGKSNRRRWYIGSQLLEFLVQTAVLQPEGSGASIHFVSRPILIDDFVNLMRDRYGLVIMPNRPNATIEDNKAFNANLNNLKRRLREIGFYTDLSDAYNTQTIRPRYSIGGQE
ncbi:MAG: hypothetical protein WCK35_00685 [Chloroflexota bacterium]